MLCGMLLCLSLLVTLVAAGWEPAEAAAFSEAITGPAFAPSVGHEHREADCCPQGGLAGCSQNGCSAAPLLSFQADSRPAAARASFPSLDQHRTGRALAPDPAPPRSPPPDA